MRYDKSFIEKRNPPPYNRSPVYSINWKRKWMAKLCLTRVCCKNCGGELEGEGYSKTICKNCGENGHWLYGNYWAYPDSDPYIDTMGNFIPSKK